MLKVGDRVEFVEKYAYCQPGDKGIVTSVRDSHPIKGGKRTATHLIAINLEKGGRTEAFQFRVRLVDKVKTDQELADEYRASVEKTFDLRNELIARGYTITTENGTILGSVKKKNFFPTIYKEISQRIDL